jgi:hypothetical protein
MSLAKGMEKAMVMPRETTKERGWPRGFGRGILMVIATVKEMH